MAADFLVKAQALVNASEDPGTKKPFDGHARKAIEAIDKALKEIEKAKRAADAND